MVEHAAFEQVEIGQRHRTADRMAGVGQPVAEHGVGMVRLAQVVHQPGRDDHAAEREIARGDALGEGDDVGLDAEDITRSEDLAEPPERRDDLVGDVENVVVAADLGDALQVAVRRHDDPARGLDRLADEGADALRADPRHLLPELVDEKVGECP